MSSLANRHRARKDEYVSNSVMLVDVLDERHQDDRFWFWEFLHGIFSSPDLDYSQFERLEAKRTRQEMEHYGLY